MSYIFILYDYDSNAILTEPIRSRNAHHLVEGYGKCYKRLQSAGITPVLQRLDNISDLLCRFITEKNIQYQLCNAYDHRHNLAERAIQTFKTHFISIVNGCDDRMPPSLWCKLLPKANATLNMLRRSRINSKFSAYEQLFGTFDFNKTLLAPLGTKVIVYGKK